MDKSTSLHCRAPCPLLSPAELKVMAPATSAGLAFTAESRKTIREILQGIDKRLLVIVGPCSIHDTVSPREYAMKLRTLAEKVSDSLFLVMRVYFEKPRTKIGWKGLLNDPYLDSSCDLGTGLLWIRQLLCELTEIRVPAASEFLEPLSPYYFADLVSWGSIGARSCGSQIHRQLASALPMPVGFKNNTDGNVDIAVHATIAARLPQTMMGIDENGRVSALKSGGNPDTHIVLRGSDKCTNYDPDSIESAAAALAAAGLPSRLVIDCSHGNSGRDPKNQPTVFQSVIRQYMEGNPHIKGAMLESHLFSGSQPLSQAPLYGISITDPCLDFVSTERLILWAHSKLQDNVLCAT